MTNNRTCPLCGSIDVVPLWPHDSALYEWECGPCGCRFNETDNHLDHDCICGCRYENPNHCQYAVVCRNCGERYYASEDHKCKEVSL